MIVRALIICRPKSDRCFSLVVRSSISIVPQSPDLFEGTLRENIDPVGEHQDADIWVSLQQESHRTT